MISGRHIERDIYGNMLELRGLSSDEKPVGKWLGSREVGNGSTYFEMDTKKTYMYDADNMVWLDITK